MERENMAERRMSLRGSPPVMAPDMFSAANVIKLFTAVSLDFSK
jgi:hypothetical protein